MRRLAGTESIPVPCRRRLTALCGPGVFAHAGPDRKLLILSRRVLPSITPPMSSLTTPPPLPLLSGRNYRCQCGQPVFFRNSQCLACGTPLGYDCERATLLALLPAKLPGAESASDATSLWQAWQVSSAPSGNSSTLSGPPEILYKRCINLSTPAACNWLMGVDDPHDRCRACRLNRTIPDLADIDHPDNGYLWGRVELAKRRLVSSLITLGPAQPTCSRPASTISSRRAAQPAAVTWSSFRPTVRPASMHGRSLKDA